MPSALDVAVVKAATTHHNSEQRASLNDADRIELTQIVEQYYGRIVDFLAKRLHGDMHTAEDLAQDTFERALHAIAKNPNAPRRESGSLEVWLFRIATNAHINHYNHTKVPGGQGERFTSLDLSIERTEYDPIDPASMDWPERIAERELITQALAQTAKANETYAAVLRLRRIEDHSIKETASMLGIGENIVGSHLERGRKIFRKAYKEITQKSQ